MEHLIKGSTLGKLSAFLLIFLQVACDTLDAPDCFQKAGEKQSITIHEYPFFNQLMINDNFDLEIVEDDTTYFELIYFKNLIPEVNYHLEDETLIFDNNNSCNFVRGYKHALLIFHSSKLENRIISQSTGKVYNRDTIRNKLTIVSTDISGTVDLKVNNAYLKFSSNSNGNFSVVGKTDSFGITAFFNDGQFTCKGLISKRATILHRGYNDIIVSPTDSLVGSIENAGRILYYGSPGIKMNIFGGGQLIQLQE